MLFLRSARWLMLALLMCIVPASSYAGVFVSINFGPPVLPVYEQPICPEPNLMWTPGYWAYGDEGYFWVPGAWVPAPFVGGLWTPAYWGWSGGLYVFHPGYWGYHVGYYGGVNYGGGYLGIGFAGGEWRGGMFAYNTAVVHVNTTVIHNTYINQTIVNQTTINNPNHVAYSGGPGGIQHQPAPEERIAEQEQHTPPTSFQTQHVQAAQANKQLYAKVNGGHPATLAVAKPLPLEAHPAPPAPKAMGGNGAPRNGAMENGGRPAYSSPERPSTAGNARPNTPPASKNAEMRDTTPVRSEPAQKQEMRQSAPPRQNPPPRANEPHSAPPKEKTPPKAAEKPKGEGHEKGR